MGITAKSGAATTSLVGEMNANFPLKGTRSQPSFICRCGVDAKKS